MSCKCSNFFFFLLCENSKILTSGKNENFPGDCTHLAVPVAPRCARAERGACQAWQQIYGKPGIERDLNPAHFRESKKTLSPEDVGPRSIVENYTRVPSSQPAAYLPMAAVSICSPTPLLGLPVGSLRPPASIPRPTPCLTECW